MIICPVHPGENVIKRKSSESAVTIPYSQTFRNIDKERPGGPLDQPGGQLQQTSRESYEFDFCGKHRVCEFLKNPFETTMIPFYWKI